MVRWLSMMILAACLALGGMAPGWASDVQGKVREASEKAAKNYLKEGLLMAGEGQDAQAASAFRQALALKPDWAEAHSLLGSALSRSGNQREAEVELRKAVQLQPDYAEGWYFLGEFLKGRGKDQEAQEAFAKAKQYARPRH
ncbi:MAG: hypothetical protein ABSA09_09655 [Desulfobaccales bacterium]